MTQQAGQKFGHIEARDSIAHQMTVHFNGDDVSSRCAAAHDGEGWVDLYFVKCEDERTITLFGDPPQRHHGDVVMEMKV